MRFERYQIILVGLLLATVTFVAHFLYINKFGLYEDDYALINLDWNLSHILEVLKARFEYWTAGRPIGYVFIYGLTYLGNSLSGLTGDYFLGFMIVLLNTILVYLLIRRFSPELIAVIAALVFCLFPADTTKELLTHDFGVQPGITFMLLASISYSSGKRILPYIFFAIGLLIYESTIIAFAFIPLLLCDINKERLLQWSKHVLICVLIVAVSLIVRYVVGEQRLETDIIGTKQSNLLFKILVSLFAGPGVSLSSFLIQPMIAIKNGSHLAMGVSAIIFVALLSVFYLIIKRESCNGKAALVEVNNNAHNDIVETYVKVNKDIVMATKFVLVGGIMWSASYLFSFTHWPPFALAGRSTSVHIGATFPASVVMAGFSWLLYVYMAGKWKLFLLAAVSAYLSILVAFGVIVQTDFAASWKQQRWFWKSVNKLVPDFGDRHYIFVLYEDDPPETKYIQTQSHMSRFVLGNLYYGDPEKRIFVPNVFLLKRNQVNEIHILKDKIEYIGKPYHTPVILKYILDPSDVALLVYKNNKIRRITGAVSFNGKRVFLPDTGRSHNLRKKPQYYLMMGERNGA